MLFTPRATLVEKEIVNTVVHLEKHNLSVQIRISLLCLFLSVSYQEERTTE